MSGKDIWYTVMHIIRDKGIELSKEQFNRYYQFANEELKRNIFGRIGSEKGYENEEQISDFLLPFKTQSNITLSSGLGITPADYWHKSRMEVTSTGIEIKFVDAEECVRKRNNIVTAPSADYPIVELKDGSFQVYPTSITQVTFVYLKKGNTPEVKLKIENGIQVYDSTNSVEPEWNTTDKYLDMIRMIVGYLSIPMNNEQILSYMEQKSDKETA